MSALFNIAQVAQLHEIQRARLKRGLPGLGPEIQELIVKLQGAEPQKKEELKTPDTWERMRRKQAKLLWERGFGDHRLRFRDFLATIPEVPEALRAENERFPHLVLVDGKSMTVDRICELASVKMRVGEIISHVVEVRWMRCNLGKHFDGIDVSSAKLADDEVGFDAKEALALFIQYPKLMPGLIMHCLESRNRMNCVCLEKQWDYWALAWHTVGKGAKDWVYPTRLKI